VQLGSLQNMVAANHRGLTPEVGMGATLISWTDRTAATIVEVHVSGKTLWVQRDHARRTDDRGMSDAQDYEYTPDPDAPVEVFTVRHDGRWVRKGSSTRSGTVLLVGARDHYRDPTF